MNRVWQPSNCISLLIVRLIHRTNDYVQKYSNLNDRFSSVKKIFNCSFHDGLPMQSAIIGICSKHRFVIRRNFSFFFTISKTLDTSRACNWDLTSPKIFVTFSIRFGSKFSAAAEFFFFADDAILCFCVERLIEWTSTHVSISFCLEFTNEWWTNGSEKSSFVRSFVR